MILIFRAAIASCRGEYHPCRKQQVNQRWVAGSYSAADKTCRRNP
ncbi:hypothetical protein F8B43_1632 [Methylorubrum populi]|uniref:Uncharacterized protein n=1 Tax=Methylorubrum populi TaxID=223967 RepID=A0A833N0D3_9HYPH|nr:hypothetical protein F8B43_1632 [Methylorubrum populi]